MGKFILNSIQPENILLKFQSRSTKYAVRIQQFWGNQYIIGNPTKKSSLRIFLNGFSFHNSICPYLLILQDFSHISSHPDLEIVNSCVTSSGGPLFLAFEWVPFSSLHFVLGDFDVILNGRVKSPVQCLNLFSLLFSPTPISTQKELFKTLSAL